MQETNAKTNHKNLSYIGIDSEKINWDLSVEELTKISIQKGYAKTTDTGAISVNTGEFTGKFPAQMGFKVIQRNGNFDCKFYDDSRQRINVDDSDGEYYQEPSKLLGKGTTVRLLLKCNGLWFSSAGFGATWKAEQIKLKVPESLEEYAFRDDDDDTFVDERDDDDDMDDDNDEEETDEMSNEEDDDEEPVKVVKKKKAKK